MKPKGRNKKQTGLLEYIEDIIGSDEFIPKIESTEALLNQINQDREIIADKLSASRKDRDSLESAKDEALHYLSLKEKLKLVDAKRLFITKEEEEAKLREVISEVETMRQQIVANIEKYNNLVITIEELKKNNESQTIILKKFRKSRDKMQKDINKEKNFIFSNKMRNKHLQEVIEETNKQNENLTTAIQAANITLTKYNQKISDNKIKIEELESKLPEEKSKLNELESEVKKENEEIQMELEEVKNELSLKNNEFREINSRITQAENEISTIKQKSIDAERRKNEKLQELEQTQTIVNTLTTEINNITIEIDQSKIDIDRLTQEIEIKEQETQNLQIQAREKARKVNEMRRMMDKQLGKSNVIKCIMELKRRENINGIYGRLGDLGTVKEEYDVAISTAAGNRLDSVVCDTTETAERCVEEVKRCKAGIVTCIILNKIPRVQLPKRIPKKSKILLNELEPKDPIFLPAFFYAIRDTLVTANIDDAKNAALDSGERHRVVTIDGKLIEVSGTFSGGGNYIKRGGMKIVDEDEYNLILEESKKVDEELKRSKDYLFNLKSQLSGINIEKLEMNLRKMEMDYDSKTKLLKTIEEQINEMEEFKEDEEDIRKVDELEQFIFENKPILEEKKTIVDTLTNNSKLLENKIRELFEIRMKPQTDIIQSIEKEIAKLNGTQNVLQVKINTSERSITKNTTQKEENEKIIEKSKREIEPLEDLIKQSQEKKRKLKTDIKELIEKIENLEESHQKQDEQLRTSKSEINELTVSIAEAKQDVKKRETDRKEIQANIFGICKQFERLGIKEDQFDQIQERTDEELELEKALIEKQLNELDPNLSSIQEYEEKDKIYQSNMEEFKEIDMKRGEIIENCNELKQNRLNMFMEGFEKIAAKLKETYQLLTLGGDAELEFVDRFDPFSGGIKFSVRPPEKSWKNISNLSGGERTISSLALVFSLHHFKPTPFYIMDEIDAALDFRNISIIANYLRERTTNAQFIVVSHRNNMFEMADRLIGIFKTEDCTSTLAINTEHRERKIEDENNDVEN
ncbi:Structural maintenance of chromosomes protein 4 [Histomonas meleagridis]|uniref:Structural maintenance of chromosomes protein 4 n=1 Tax=Histomonas meleagridis TaxID=135588 RepID=UPI00355A49D3|nr:Structural maintenance of chromosomes protein 4 [Histomonas meleagridis]KAH0805660.1 Structural maintenance of chromosomes protein 4 [Histomonas meleagridis]